jgi:hypothetical protein
MKILVFLALLYSTGALAASPNNTVVLAGSTSLITDAAGNTWGISTAPCTATWATQGMTRMVTVNGVADATTCSVKEIATVNGVIWQENDGLQWYSKATPTAAWSAGTATSPLPVAPPAQAVLTWTAPTTNTNGTPIIVPLTYNVYRGSSITTLRKLTTVAALTYTDPAGSATPTTYYYAVTATCAACTESADSGIVSDTIAAPPLTPAAPGGLAAH